jgi:hypothetical protein
MRSARVSLTLKAGAPVTIDFMDGHVPNYSAINPKLPDAFAQIAYDLAEFCSREGREVVLNPRRPAEQVQAIERVEIELVSESKEARHYKLTGIGTGLALDGDQIWIDNAATVATDLLKAIVVEANRRGRSFPGLMLRIERHPLGDLAAK